MIRWSASCDDPQAHPAMIRALNPVADRAVTAGLLARAADYALLETGLPPDARTLDGFFTSSHPAIDPATTRHLGLFQGSALAVIAELAFGFPNPEDAYIGLLLAAPEYRNQGLGVEMLDHLMAIARARQCRRILLAVMGANTGGKRFWRRQGFATVLTTDPVLCGQKTHIYHRMARDLPPA